ncbi:MAG: MCP four helix bundle domain-containing protein, partial [Oscillospiraceae bacterium]|nr:MCP four helix bundle domain-containing protein [Oscillospiraceae bacterium]
MKKTAVKNILLTSFIAMAVLTLFIGGVSIYSINEMSRRDREMYDYTPVVNTLGVIADHFQRINAGLYRLVLYSSELNTAETDAVNEGIDYSVGVIQVSVDDYMQTAFDFAVEKNFYDFKAVYENDFLPLVENVRTELSRND